MKNQPRNGRVTDMQAVKKLELIWFLSLLGGAALLVLLLWLTGTTDPGNALRIVAWIFIPVALGLNIWLRKQKLRASSMSLDDVRDRIDADAVRSVKENKGEVQAVKELRRQEPRLSLKDALELVRAL